MTRYWSGLSTHITIEQVLLRFGGRGGLKRGRGTNKTQRLVWLISIHACTHVNFAMQTLASVQYQSNEQNRISKRYIQTTGCAEAMDWEKYLGVLIWLIRKEIPSNHCWFKKQ